jgi:hypothetical protein
MTKRIIIALFNALFIFFFSTFLISTIVESAQTMSAIVPGIPDDENFNASRVFQNYFNYTFYGIIIAVLHFMSEMILKKSIFSHFWRHILEEKKD